MIFGFFNKKNKSSQSKSKPKKIVNKASKTKEPKRELVGNIVHYFPKVKAAVIKVKKGPLLEGDVIYITGHTTNIKQKISSMQIDHEPIKKAIKGKEVGIRVKERVRVTDKVYKDKK